MDAMSNQPRVGAVILSMGNRPSELAKALATLRAQRGIDLDIFLVGNGWSPERVPDWVRTVHLEENIGCPGGRNVGAREVRGEYIFFYDDDAFLPEDDILVRMVAAMTPGVAVVQPRGTDPDGRTQPRRWVPRLWVRENDSGGDVAVFWEALAMIRREAFEQVGGWAGEFFFAHEGIDLAMRLLDRGWRIRYEPSIVVCHPATPPARHAVYYRTNARNRAWVARRNLPGALVPIYLAVWVAATMVRVRDRHALVMWFSGFWEGLTSELPNHRHPISWRTVLRMTRLGRPPVW